MHDGRVARCRELPCLCRRGTTIFDHRIALDYQGMLRQDERLGGVPGGAAHPIMNVL